MSTEQTAEAREQRPRRRVTIRSGTSHGRASVALAGADVAVQAAPDGPDDAPAAPAGCPCASGF